MSDIFISYAREDREKARTIAEALEQYGWSVFWDRKIPPGKTWDEVIGNALNTSKCMIVLWSKVSVNRDWVKEEANVGKKRNILVPALIDNADIPIGFTLIQAADLTDWIPDKSDPGFAELVNSITEKVGTPPVSKLAEAEKRKKIEEERKRQLREEAKRQAEEEERWHMQKQIDVLYKNALELVHLQQWEEAAEKMEEILALDSQFADPEGVSTRVEVELKKKSIDVEKELQERKATKKRMRRIILFATPLVIIAVFIVIYIINPFSRKETVPIPPPKHVERLLSNYFTALQRKDNVTLSTIAIEPVALEPEGWEIMNVSEEYIVGFEYSVMEAKIAWLSTQYKMPASGDFTGEVQNIEVDVKTEGQSGINNYRVYLRRYTIHDVATGETHPGRWIIAKFENIN
jgi:hypothetical protein